MDSGSLFPLASTLCTDTWPKTIFSSFHLFETAVLFAGGDWTRMVAMSAEQIQNDAALMDKISGRITNASDEELRPLWAKNHGTCTSWAVLMASKIATDLNEISFADSGHHRLAFTNCGILVDSSAREALQLEDDVRKKHRKATYIMKGIGQGQPSLSYT